MRSYILQSDTDFSALVPEHSSKAATNAPCSMVFNRLHITYNGLLSACCIDFNHDLILADLNNISLSEAWFCEKAIAFRKTHIEKDVRGTMCNGCFHGKCMPYLPL